jgi:tonB family C-terminal domain
VFAKNIQHGHNAPISKQRGTTVPAGSNKFKPLNRQENVMNMKNILSATLLVAGLFTAQTAAAEVRFFQDAGRADGKVAMSFTIKADGSISDARITRSSGNAATDSAAIEWMQHQTMRPVFVNGEAKDFRIVKEIKFAA